MSEVGIYSEESMQAADVLEASGLLVGHGTSEFRVENTACVIDKCFSRLVEERSNAEGADDSEAVRIRREVSIYCSVIRNLLQSMEEECLTK